jgi:hypothetical protein
VGLSWFVGYAAVTVHGHVALDRLSAEIATENSRQPLPFDPRTQSLVVVGQRYEAPNAERLLTTYLLPVVYEENEDAGGPARARDGRPRFTALRLGAPELCDTITEDARLKAAVTRHGKTIVNGTSVCLYGAIEAPDQPVIRIRSEQEKLRIIGAEGNIERTTLASGDDKREVASVRAAPYQYLPLPIVGCFFSGRGSGWDCSYEFWKETQRPYPDNLALVGKSLGLEPASRASRLEQIRAASPAALERARDLDEAAAAAELDRLLAHPIGSTAELNLNVLSARPDLMASRAERLAAAAAEALTTRDNWRDNQTWSVLMVALPDAEFRRVGPDFVAAVLERWITQSRRSSVHLGERLIYRLADLGPAALPLLERIYQYNASFDRLASVVTLCRLGAPGLLGASVANVTEKIREQVFGDEHDPHAQEMREAMILALMRQGRGDVADASRRQYEQSTAARRGSRSGDVSVWSKDFEEKSRTMTPSSPADACMIARR